MFELSIMDRKHGHFVHSWDPSNSVEIEKAREIFNSLKKLGYAIFETNQTNEGPVANVVHTFDALDASYTFQEPKIEMNKNLPTTPGELVKKVPTTNKPQSVIPPPTPRHNRQLTAIPPLLGG